MKNIKLPVIFNSISELHRALGLPKPLHPLISLVDYGTITVHTADLEKGMLFNFYKISFKKDFSGRIKYGQSHYDFDEGGLSFVSPGQLITALEGEAKYGGYTLLVHPDFIRSYPLGRNIKNYGFFSYAANEALYLSEKERLVIVGLFKNIEQELGSAIDQLSQDVLVSQVELLLNYSKRYYSRQFITRKEPSGELLARFEELLSDYFGTGKPLINGLPAVEQIAGELKVSAHYLSDMLRSLTGQNTQQHVHAKLIEKAKELLTSGELSVAEIAYQLGFEHPQSFNRLFKRKTALSPLDFRRSLN
ncbi:helix-turn-helix domain-containing protein [Pedobacter sp. R-06]|uniref:helix-turn-helix domain-containing protein n=1 Tax=Pedobacter sp. R-06 TaxID=3404051 RepID=UPI003CF52441